MFKRRGIEVNWCPGLLGHPGLQIQSHPFFIFLGVLIASHLFVFFVPLSQARLRKAFEEALSPNCLILFEGFTHRTYKYQSLTDIDFTLSVVHS